MANQYVILIMEPAWSGVEAADPDYDWDEAWSQHNAFRDAVAAAGGQVLDGDALAPPKWAFRVDPAKAGEQHPLITDGPFAETKEIVAGYYKIELPDDADVRAVAATCPTDGWLEVYPVAELPDPS
jgi:hypothetical protein